MTDNRTSADVIEVMARAMCFWDGPDGCGCQERCERPMEPTNIWLQAARTAHHATLATQPADPEEPTPEMVGAGVKEAITGPGDRYYRDKIAAIYKAMLATRIASPQGAAGFGEGV